MINLYIDNHKFHYEMENLVRAFLPNEKINKVYDNKDFVKPYIFTSIGEKIVVRVNIDDFDKTLESSKDSMDDELEMALLIYDLLKEHLKRELPWGVLTGIRPCKLFTSLINEKDIDYARSIFKNKFRVSDEKIKLTESIYNSQKEIIAKSNDKSFSLYVSIPFCPTRCNYCSFVSTAVAKAKKIVPVYFDLLLKEIEYTGKIVKELGLELLTVYIGGGTPTTLSANDIDILISTIEKNFDLSKCIEFTVEAGRPDTITENKLISLSKHNISRISINPQTLNDSVLEAIGRRHTTKQTIDAFKLSRKNNFDNINMDLIAGLTTDTLDSFKKSVDGVINLGPESITLHTLAIKASSNITIDGEDDIKETDVKLTKDMLDYANEKFYENGYSPYYLYKQSKTVGNFENVGWSKENIESYYNVYMMEEIHSVLACGAHAVSKLKDPNSKYLERIFNFKYPFEYVDRFDEMLKRKDRVISFYKEYLG